MHYLAAKDAVVRYVLLSLSRKYSSLPNTQRLLSFSEIHLDLFFVVSLSLILFLSLSLSLSLSLYLTLSTSLSFSSSLFLSLSHSLPLSFSLSFSLPFSFSLSLPNSTAISEAYRNGTLTTEGVRRVLRLNPSKMGKIADFFVREIAEAIPRAPINSFEKTVSNQNISGTI